MTPVHSIYSLIINMYESDVALVETNRIYENGGMSLSRFVAKDGDFPLVHAVQLSSLTLMESSSSVLRCLVERLT